MKKSIVAILAAISLAITIGVIAQPQANQPAKPSAGAPANPAVIAKLQEIVSIRERMVKVYEDQQRMGLAIPFDPVEIELVEARIQLARELNQTDTVIRELRHHIALRERMVKLAQETFAKGRLPAYEIDKLKVALLETEIRLLRETK